MPPRERYQARPRSYRERPPEWEYPSGSDVRRVNVNGAIAEAGRQWFVCEALGGRRVRVERFDGQLLVSYRHLYIREIDLQRATTQALVVAHRHRCTCSGHPTGDLRKCIAHPENEETQTLKV